MKKVKVKCSSCGDKRKFEKDELERAMDQEQKCIFYNCPNCNRLMVITSHQFKRQTRWWRYILPPRLYLVVLVPVLLLTLSTGDYSLLTFPLRLFGWLCAISFLGSVLLSLLMRRDLSELYFEIFVLGFLSIKTIDCFQSSDYSLLYLSQQAERGDAQAQFQMGLLFLCTTAYIGDPLLPSYAYYNWAERDEEKALYWLEKSSEQGYHLATMKLVELCRSENKADKALELIKIAAEAGHPDAELELGRHYYSLKTEEGRKESNIWYEKAASKGNTQAIIGLCSENMTEDADLTKQEKALGFLKKAAESGDTKCQETLAEFLLYGMPGVEKDTDAALRYLELAASAGVQTAQCALATLYIAGGVVKRNTEKAFELLSSAYPADKVGDDSLRKGGNDLSFQPKQSSKLIMLIRRVQADKYSGAQYIIGLLYFYGICLVRDNNKALYWINKAREGYHRGATEFLKD